MSTADPCLLPVGIDELCWQREGHEPPCGDPLPPYTHKPVTTVGGLRVVGWSSPVPVVVEGPDHIAPADLCTECGGWGGWTETNRHGDEIDSPCHHCGETGVEP